MYVCMRNVLYGMYCELYHESLDVRPLSARSGRQTQKAATKQLAFCGTPLGPVRCVYTIH